MKLIIKIKAKKIILSLYRKNKLLDEASFLDERNLSEKLLPAIDKLLQKNQLATADIQKVEVKSDIGEPFTTYRIAKSVEKAFNWAISVDN